jgi:hypothetical protein
MAAHELIWRRMNQAEKVDAAGGRSLVNKGYPGRGALAGHRDDEGITP